LLSTARTGSTARVPSSDQNSSSSSTSRSLSSFFAVSVSVFSAVASTLFSVTDSVFGSGGAFKPVFSHCTFPSAAEMLAIFVAGCSSPTLRRAGRSVV